MTQKTMVEELNRILREENQALIEINEKSTKETTSMKEKIESAKRSYKRKM
jgi:predicted transcriptional regulator